MKIIEKIIKVIKNPIILVNYIKNRLMYLFYKKILNNGERFDPILFKRFGFSDKTQENRYKFVKQFINKTDNILDIACGTGYGIDIISNSFNHATGVDISPEAINFANKYYKNEKNLFYVDNLFNINKKYDTVISFETIEHVNENFDKILEKLISITNKYLILSTPFNEDVGANKHHKHAKIKEDHFNLLKNYGKINFYFQGPNNEIGTVKRDVKFENIIVVVKKY